MTIERSAEAQAFLATVDAAAPGAVSACAGWTTHEIAAHVTGIAVEVGRHLKPYLQGDPVPETRSFEEREAPLQALGHAELLTRLDDEETTMRALVADVLDREPDAIIPWTGRRMAVAKFIPHLRNEHALHRWDVAGEDDVSLELLGTRTSLITPSANSGRSCSPPAADTTRTRTPTSGSAYEATGSETYGCSSRREPQRWPGPTTTSMNPAWTSTRRHGMSSSGVDDQIVVDRSVATYPTRPRTPPSAAQRLLTTNLPQGHDRAARRGSTDSGSARRYPLRRQPLLRQRAVDDGGAQAPVFGFGTTVGREGRGELLRVAPKRVRSTGPQTIA